MSEPRERIEAAIKQAHTLIPPQPRGTASDVWVEIMQDDLEILARAAEVLLKEHRVETADGGMTRICNACDHYWPCPVLLEVVRGGKPAKEEA